MKGGKRRAERKNSKENVGARPGGTRLPRDGAVCRREGSGEGAKRRAVPVCPESGFCLFLPLFTLSSLALTADLPGGTEHPWGYSGRILGRGDFEEAAGLAEVGVSLPGSRVPCGSGHPGPSLAAWVTPTTPEAWARPSASTGPEEEAHHSLASAPLSFSFVSGHGAPGI